MLFLKFDRISMNHPDKCHSHITYHTTKKRPKQIKKQFIAMISITTLLVVVFVHLSNFTTILYALPTGFVYVQTIIPDIQLSLRYASEENFLGHRVNGYLSNVSILTEQAALALKQAQILAKEQGYEFVFYDGYRPQKSVNQFMNWSLDSSIPQIKKPFYYPRVNKEDTFTLGYIAAKSGHTRGSTIDLTLIPYGKRIQNPLTPIQRNLTDNSTIFYLNDGTIDMGSSFDLFDQASHTNSTLVDITYQQRRLILKNLMDQAGFTNYDREWWHYTLKNEPFPDTYFDFDIQSSSSNKISHQYLFLSVFSLVFFLMKLDVHSYRNIFI